MRSHATKLLVPLAGIEPALLAELDFESSASTNSATGAPGQPLPALRSGRNIAAVRRRSTRCEKACLDRGAPTRYERLTGWRASDVWHHGQFPDFAQRLAGAGRRTGDFGDCGGDDCRRLVLPAGAWPAALSDV